jgi:hypothetical protein
MKNRRGRPLVAIWFFLDCPLVVAIHLSLCLRFCHITDNKIMIIEVKGKVFPVHTVEAYRGHRNIGCFFFLLDR